MIKINNSTTLSFGPEALLLAARMSLFVGPFLLVWGVWQHFALERFTSSAQALGAEVARVDTIIRDGERYFRPTFAIEQKPTSREVFEYTGITWNGQNLHFVGEKANGFFVQETGSFRSVSQLERDQGEVRVLFGIGVPLFLFAMIFWYFQALSKRSSKP